MIAIAKSIIYTATLTACTVLILNGYIVTPIIIFVTGILILEDVGK